MNPWLYGVVAVVPVATIVGFLTGSPVWAWGAPAFVFGLMPLIELFLPAPVENVSDQRALSALRGLRFDLPIYGAVLLHAVTLGLFFGRITSFEGWTQVGLVVSVGVSVLMRGGAWCRVRWGGSIGIVGRRVPPLRSGWSNPAGHARQACHVTGRAWYATH